MQPYCCVRQYTAEWSSAREQCVFTGSRIASLSGYSKYPRDEKVTSAFVQKIFRDGHENEARAVNWLSSYWPSRIYETGLWIKDCSVGRIGTSPDRLLFYQGDIAPLEVKTFSEFRIDRAFVPELDHLIQCLVHCYVLETPGCILLIWDPQSKQGQSFVVYANPDIVEELLRECVKAPKRNKTQSQKHDLQVCIDVDPIDLSILQ